MYVGLKLLSPWQVNPTEDLMSAREPLHPSSSSTSTFSEFHRRGLLIAETLSEVWSLLADDSIAGVVLKRSSPEWSKVLADISEHFRTPLKGIFLTEDLPTQPQSLHDYVWDTGFPEKFPRSAHILLDDMQELLNFVSRVNNTGRDQIASGVAWMHQDPKGVHVDAKAALVSVVTYLGPGPILYSPDDVVDRTKCNHLEIRSVAQSFRTPINWPVFIKGRVDLSRPAGPDNFGLPHASPEATDPLHGFSRRLIFAVQAYGPCIASQNLFNRLSDFVALTPGHYVPGHYVSEA